MLELHLRVSESHALRLLVRFDKILVFGSGMVVSFVIATSTEIRKQALQHCSETLQGFRLSVQGTRKTLRNCWTVPHVLRLWHTRSSVVEPSRFWARPGHRGREFICSGALG